MRSKGLDGEWSPVKVAKYHGVGSTVVQLLEERAKEKLESTKAENVWDEQLHASRKADQKTAWCDCCFAVGTSHLFTSSSSSTILFETAPALFANAGVNSSFAGFDIIVRAA